jgi:hypothetical protein
VRLVFLYEKQKIIEIYVKIKEIEKRKCRERNFGRAMSSCLDRRGWSFGHELNN